MQETIWKSIPEIDGIGEISNDGWFKYYNWCRTGKEKITRGSNTGDGHYAVQTILVHRLVAKAFVPIPERYEGITVDDLVVHHDDENPANNNADNLRWMTLAEHKALHASKAIEMLSMDWEHEAYFPSAAECQRQTGISASSISQLCNGSGRRKSAGGHRFRHVIPN